jgi:hypothetical protein
MTTLMTTSMTTPANLRTRSGKVHARLEPGSNQLYDKRRRGEPAMVIAVLAVIVVLAVAILLPRLYRKDRDTGGKSLATLLLLILLAVFGGAAVGQLVFAVLR